MLYLNRLPIIFIIVCIGLSACATATPISTTTPVPTETFTPTASPPTETPTAFPTPEPTATATPETIPSKPTEVTFNLTNGETLSMPAFILNNPSEDPAILEQQQIKTLEVALEYMVNVRSVAWGYDGKDRTNEVSEQDYEFVFSFVDLVGQKEWLATNFRLPQDEYVDDQDAFLVSNIIKYDGGYIFVFKNNNLESPKRYEAIFIKIPSQIISNLLKKAKVPEKP